MTVLELSRWQFGNTTVYHFIFVPLTLGLSYLVAIMQTGPAPAPQVPGPGAAEPVGGRP